MIEPFRAAVLGSPIDHSLSPVLHRAAYVALGLDGDYAAIEVDESGLSRFWETLDDSWVGLSLTMPLKVTVLPLLDGITDCARAVGAVNTVVFDDGGATGHNTDVPGMITALDEVQPDRDRIRSAAIIGAGATARSAVAAVIERHGEHVTLVAYARREEQTLELAELAGRIGGRLDVGVWSDVAQALSSDLVVSTLPGGSDLQAALPGSVGVLLDVAYDPWPTRLSSRWREAGGLVASGADLLLWQATEQVELMTGRPAPVAAMRSALVAALDDRASSPI